MLHRRGLVIAAGAAGAAAAPATTRPAPATTAPAVSPSSAASTSTSVPASTVVTTFDPWLLSGRLTPGFVVKVVDKGQCSTPSVTSTDPSAWSCVLATAPATPASSCFAPPGATAVVEVACMDAATAGTPVTLVQLQPPLAAATRTGTTGPGAWELRLANGDVCQKLPGPHTRFGSVTLLYGCRGNVVGYASTPDASEEPWTVTFLTGITCTRQRCSGPAEVIAVTEVWR